MIEKIYHGAGIKTNGTLLTDLSDLSDIDASLSESKLPDSVNNIESEKQRMVSEVNGDVLHANDILDNDVSTPILANRMCEEKHNDAAEKGTESSIFLTPQISKKDETGRFRRVLSDQQLRHKLLHMGCVCLAMVAMGWRQSMTGTTLPDLRLITNVTLSRISWIISAVALGALAGCFGCGFLYDRFNKYAIFIGLLVSMATITVITPWCSNFISMVTIHVLNGICVGGIDTVVAADVVLVWGQKSAPFLQTVNFAFSIGATLSPVTSEPFMAKQSEDVPVLNSSSNQAIPNLTSVADISVNIDTIDANGYNPDFGQTSIHFAYIISAAVSGLVTVCFVLVLCLIGNVHEQKKTTEEISCKEAIHHDDQAISRNHPRDNDYTDRCNHQDNEYTKAVYPLSRGWKLVFICIMSVMLSVYAISERHYYNYLMTYLVDRLHWTKSQGSNATTLFWLAFAIGRLVAVFLVRSLKQISIFGIFLSILVSGEVAMYFGVCYGVSSLITISFILHGCGMSALFANILSWLSVNVCPMTGKVASAVFTMMIIGSIIFPLIAGNVMTSLSYDWFLYLEMILTGIFSVLVIFVELLYRFLTK